MLRVLVTGSGSRYEIDQGGNIVSGDKFVELCEALGKVLASRQHQIFLLSDNNHHADPHLLRGYAGQAQAKTIQVPPIECLSVIPMIQKTSLRSSFVNLGNSCHMSSWRTWT